MSSGSGEVLLSARDLIRSLDKHILWSGISFDVHRGDILFLRGPSGVGKTLLLRTLACLDPVEVGRYGLDGSTAGRGRAAAECMSVCRHMCAHRAVAQHEGWLLLVMI